MARVLNLLGAAIGDQLIAGDPGINEPGYWEDAEVVDFHDRFLLGCGLSWHAIEPLPSDADCSGATQDAIDWIRGKVGQQFTDEPLWLVKDPRLCRLSRLWRSALRAEGIAPAHLIAIRHPAEVVASLVRRDGMATSHALLLWARYLTDAIAATAGETRAVCDYGELMRDWRAQVRGFEEQLGIQWPIGIDAAASAIEAFLRPEQRRHANLVVDAHPLWREAEALYRELRSVALGGGDWSRVEHVADSLRLRIEEIQPLVSPVLRFAWDQDERASRVQRLLDRERSALGEEGGVAAIRQRMRELQHEVDAAVEHSNAAEQDRLAAEAARENAENARAGAEAIRDEALQRQRVAEAQLENEQRLRNGLEEQVRVLQRQLLQSQAQVREAQASLLELHASRSWRITAPLRAVSQAFRAIAGTQRIRALVRAVRGIYHRLPITYSNRLRIRSVAYRVRHPFSGAQAASSLWREATRLDRLQRADVGATDHGFAQQLPQDVEGVAGHAAARYIGQVLETARAPGAEHVPCRDPAVPAALKAKAIAFYLPQFHPIAENDEWWGRGFTEWTNVSKAVPQFVGHYQPRLPGELGYYDLRVVDVMRRQVELARQYGLAGFCFHYYWFDGRRLLERPLQQYLDDPSLDFPFCICWANENWTRRWDGQDSEVLMAQNHSPESDQRFIRDLLPLLRDARYIRLDGKPLVVVYRPSILPDARATLERWRQICRDEGIGELCLVMAQFDREDPTEYGFDAAVEFPPHKLARELTVRNGELELINRNYAGHVLDYRELVDTAVAWPVSDFPLIRGLSPSWDNEARKPGRGYTFIQSTPALYGYWLQEAVAFARRHPVQGEALVFINAWNEWGEGAYLEPDRRYGYAYLQATRDVLSAEPIDSVSPGQRIVVVAHDAHPHGAQYLSLNLCRELAAMGYAVDAVLLGPGELESEFERTAKVHRVPAGARAGELARLARELARSGARHAIANSAVCGLFAGHLADVGMQVVTLVHELPGVIAEYALKPHLQVAAAKCEAMVFAADAVRCGVESVVPLPGDKCRIRPQGLYKRNRFRSPQQRDEARVELRRRLGLPAESHVLLGVGYADLRKGVDLFVDAGASLVAAYPDCHLVWLGHFDQSLEPRIRARVEELGLQSNVHFPGRSEDTDPFYAGADVLLLSSREDPYPSVVMEALEVGLPVVAYADAGGAAALLARGCGVLAPQTTAEDLAAAAANLLRDAQERERLGRVGEQIVSAEYGFRRYLFDLLSLVGIRLPRVSVVVPNYNYAHLLSGRLQSIFSQTLPPYEVIVLDDASSDDSGEVIRRWAVSHGIRAVFSTTNSGSVFRQWQRGAELAQGDFVWIAEADDLSYPEFLEKVMHAFRDPTVAMSYSQSEQIGEQGEHLAPDYRSYTDEISTTRWQHAFVASLDEELGAGLAVKNTIPNVSAVVFRRDALLTALGSGMEQILSYRIAGDWATYAHVLEQGRLAFWPEPLNRHRRHAQGVTLGSEVEGHLLEVLQMQCWLRTRYRVAAEQSAAADHYAERLRVQFGLEQGADLPSLRSRAERREQEIRE